MDQHTLQCNHSPFIMKSGLVFCCLLAFASAAPNPFANKTEPYKKSGIQNIINGEDAKYGFFNHILLLKQYGSFVCGASLISSTRGLTAAHCLTAGKLYSVVAGELDRDVDSGYEVERAVTSFVKYPQYDDDDFTKYDIAVLKFDSIPNSKYVAPIKRWTAADGDLRHTTCNISGWGRTIGNSSDKPNVLKFGEMWVISNSACRSRLGGVILNSHVCIQRYSYERASCRGDSGGPLECLTFGGEYKLVGVSSFGKQGCPGNYPSVYTRVTSYESWIQSNM